MANRFTDSRKWDDPWFRKLPCKYKAFFIFLIDRCNHAGIWKVDFESAEFHIGEKFDKNEVISIMENRIIELNDKWFIPKFVCFQYQVNSVNELNPANRVHLSVLNLLQKEGAFKGLTRGIQGCKDKDYDKDYNKYIPTFTKEFDSIWGSYPNRIGKKMAFKHFLSSIKTEKDLADIKIALNNYIKSERVAKGFIQNGSTWFNNWKDWVNAEIKPKKHEMPPL